MKVDFSRLQKIIADDDSKNKLSNNASVCLDEYMNYITNYLLKCKELNEEELAMLVISEQNWLLRKDFFTSKATVNIGDIFYADLGKNYKPECSYGHPVLIMELIGNMIFVVPVSSSKDKIKEAYHPIDNKDGNTNLRKVTAEEGFKSECSLLLSNARTISGGRLLEKKENIFNSEKGKELFEEVKNTMLLRYFPKQKIKMDKLITETERGIKENKELKDEIETLKKQIVELQTKGKK